MVCVFVVQLFSLSHLSVLTSFIADEFSESSSLIHSNMHPFNVNIFPCIGLQDTGVYLKKILFFLWVFVYPICLFKWIPPQSRRGKVALRVAAGIRQVGHSFHYTVTPLRLSFLSLVSSVSILCSPSWPLSHLHLSHLLLDYFSLFLSLSLSLSLSLIDSITSIFIPTNTQVTTLSLFLSHMLRPIPSCRQSGAMQEWQRRQQLLWHILARRAHTEKAGGKKTKEEEEEEEKTRRRWEGGGGEEEEEDTTLSKGHRRTGEGEEDKKEEQGKESRGVLQPCQTHLCRGTALPQHRE